MPEFRAEIRITPRAGVLDPEGETIGRALVDLGWEGVDDVRAGRLIHLRLDADAAAEAEEEVRGMCEELIANPVIEDYEIRIDRAEATDGADGGEAATEPRAAREADAGGEERPR